MIEIYGKDNCAYCNMAKQLCEQKKKDFKYLQLNVDYTQEEFFEKFPTARTFPQITIDEESIGGFMELREIIL
jgi:glutaredoxin